MIDEFNLSAKKEEANEQENAFYWESDVKEFIKIIEIEATKFGLTMGERIEIIRKRAGDKLAGDALK